MTSTLKENQEYTQNFNTGQKDGQLFIGTKKAQAVIKSHRRKARELSLTTGDIMVHFEPDKTLTNVLAETQALGKLTNPEHCEEFEPISSGAILLFGVPVETNCELIKLFFETKSTTEGEKVVKVRLHADDGYAIVYFKDPKAVTNVCKKRSLHLSGHNVEVIPLAEYLSLTKSSSMIAKAPDELSFYMDMESMRAPLVKELATCHAEVSWDENPLQVLCTAEGCQRNLLRSWKAEVNDVIDRYVDKLTANVVVFTPDKWKDMKQALESVKIEDPSTIAVILDAKTCSVKISTAEDYKESDLRTITETLKRV